MNETTAKPASTCRSCGAPVAWKKTPAGKNCPYDIVDGVVTETSHFTSCPQASDWSRRTPTENHAEPGQPEAPASTAVVVAPAPAAPQLPLEQDIRALGKAMALSGFFKDAPDQAKAVVKILAGKELGFGPVASMTGVYIIENKVSISANLMAAAVKRTRRYNYRIREHTPTVCRIEFLEEGESVGESTFTIEDAQKAGVTNKPTWQRFPRNMLFARAMSNGARWYCPDVFGGPVYTPEELDRDELEDAAGD